MRVLLASQFFAPVAGGQERMVQDIREELTGRGHRVVIATTTPSTDPDVRRVRLLSSYALGARHPSDRRHHPPFPDPLAVRDLRQLVRAERPDIVHAHDWIAHSVAPALDATTPLVLSLHDYGLRCATKRLVREGVNCGGPSLTACVACSAAMYGAPRGCPTALGLRASTPGVLKRASLVVPVSRAVAEALCLENLKVSFEVIPNFLSENRLRDFAAPPAPRPAWLPKERFVLFAGDATHDKGVPVLLSALRSLPDPLRLVLIGRTFLPPEDLIHPGITVLGLRSPDEVRHAMSHAMAVVVPSQWREPFGLVALEGMAAGKPVVASRIGGLAEVIEHDVSGVLVEPGDPTALASALTRLATDSALRTRLGDAARQRANLFRGSVIVPRFERAYMRLVGLHARS